MKKNNQILIYAVTLIGAILMLAGSCKKSDEEGLVTDIDGNVYHTVTIGTQVWMVENLKTTHYRNGDAISNVTDNAAWVALKTEAYCWFVNDIANKDTHGALYNWYAVSDIRNLCPSGWHVPSDTEWTILEDYLGGQDVAGGKLKEAGTSHWESPNTGATNESGFSALPVGYRWNVFYTGIYEQGEAFWWTNTAAYGNTSAWKRVLGYDSAKSIRGAMGGGAGLSVRCIKD